MWFWHQANLHTVDSTRQYNAFVIIMRIIRQLLYRGYQFRGSTIHHVDFGKPESFKKMETSEACFYWLGRYFKLILEGSPHFIEKMKIETRT